MTRLTRAKQITRVSALGVGITLLVLIIGQIGFKLLNSITVDKRQAELQARPDVAYGAIPAPVLSPVQMNLNAINMRLDLVNGSLPQSTVSAKVFKVGQPALSLSAQDRARARAANLGFTSQPNQPNPTTFTWNDGLRNLSINLQDQTFTLTTNPNNINFNLRQSFGQFDPMQQRVSQYLKNQFTFLDLLEDQPMVGFVNWTGSTFLPQDPDASAPSNYVQATVLRQALDNKPVYSAKGKFGPINLIVIPQLQTAKSNNGLDQDQILQMTSDYFTIDQTGFATYPVVDPQTAYNQLAAKPGAYIVSVLPTGTTSATSLANASVQFVTLVYLEPDSQNSAYVQPVWMFEGRGSTNAGDASWVAYVPAVDFAKTQTLVTSQKSNQ